jgi:hypothetical protein
MGLMTTPAKIFLAGFIRIIHILVILFVISTPILITTVDLLILHVTFCVSILIHWYYNNNICSLTLIEAKLRGIEIEGGFIYKIIAPIYDFLHIPLISENNFQNIVYVFVIGLMTMSIYKLIANRKAVYHYSKKTLEAFGF